MNRWQALISILVLLMIGLTAFLAYRVSTVYVQSQETRAFLQHVAQTPQKLDPQDLNQLQAQAEALYKRHPSPELRDVLFDIDLKYAWEFPDKDVPELQSAFKLGREMYLDLDSAAGDPDSTGNQSAAEIGSQLSWAYMYAGLPQEVRRWHNELIPKAPYLRDRVHLYEASACLMLDDPAAARTLVQQDLRAFGGRGETRASAMAIYVMLHDYRSASESESDMAQNMDTDANYYWMYADYLIDQQRFAEAETVINKALPQDIGNAYLLQQQAVVKAAHDGMHTSDVQNLIATVAADTRDPTTLPGVEANIEERLWDASGDAKWWKALCGTALQHPQDPDALTALAQGWARRAPDDSLLQTTALPQNWQHPLEVANAAAAVAQTSFQRIRSLLTVTEAACARDADGQYPPSSAAHGLEAFQLALGDPALPDSVRDGPLPAYEDTLTSDVVKQRRSTDPAFDAAIHNAVIAFLNRRQELFASEVPLTPLPLEQPRAAAQSQN